MKQRILSLFLAVLMVVSAVPVLVLSVAAVGARAEFETSFEAGGVNWPVPETSNGSLYTPDFQGNWTVGVMTAGTITQMNQYTDASKYLTINGQQWGDSHVFFWQTSGEAALLGASSIDWPGDATSEAGTGPGSYYSEVNNYRNKSAIAYTYTSSYEGTVDLSMIGMSLRNEKNKERPLEDGEIYQAYFAIFVNSKMIWPVEGGSYSNPADFAIYPQATTEGEGEDATTVTIKEVGTEINPVDALKNVPINCGDQIHFVAARYNCRYLKFTPVVKFHDNYNIAPTAMTATFGPSSPAWPQQRNMNGAGRLTQEDAYWLLGGFDTATNTFTAYPTIKRAGSDTWVAAGVDRSDYVKNNGVSIVSSVGESQGAYMFGSDETTAAPAYQYTAIATGKVNFAVDGNALLFNSDLDAVANASAKIAYYINGEKIGEATVTSDAAGVVTVTGIPTDVDVVKGDEIAFVGIAGENAVMLKAQPTVAYTAIESFMAEETEEPYALSMEEEELVVGDKIAIRFSAFATRGVYQDSDEGVVLRIWDSSVEGELTAENAVANVPMTLDINAGYAYVCDYDEFAPKQMTDTITIQAYTTVDGEEKCASVPKKVSLANIAYNQYLAAVAAEDTKTAKTMVAVLNYGAAAQKYFAYNVENLANKDLPAELQVIEKKEDGYYSAAIMDTKEPQSTNWSSSEITSVSLIFDSTLSMRVYVDVTADEVNCPTTIWTGLTEEELENSKVGTEIDGANSFILSDLGLDDLSKTFYFQVRVVHEKLLFGTTYGKITYYGNIFSYSVEAYVARMAYEADKPELSDLLHALMNLSACVTEA